MATMRHSESRRLYSWWWDSHISPKNSKWLQDNLTDMDSKVKAMIKLIEEDADSFARRAEMYYKQRPELMKMVEEFYRAYRALAERYDHATGALRQAHNTMAKAFPNQIPLALTDDSPSGSSGPEVEPRTPDMPSPIQTLFEFDDFDKDACLPSHSHVIKRSGTYSDETNKLSRKGLKQLNEIYPTGEGEEAYANFSEGRVKKGLHFLAEEGKGYEYKNSRGLKEDTQNEIKRLREELTLLLTENQNLKSQKTSESERADKAESDVRNLKDSLSKLSFENEDVTLEYKQAVERLCLRLLFPPFSLAPDPSPSSSRHQIDLIPCAINSSQISGARQPIPIPMSAAAATDFYAVLGLDKDCSDSELRNAYKKLALRWHPDRCSDKNEAKEKFQTIQEAYSVLSDPDKRLMYDFGVYNDNDDDENAGMGDFLDELAEMMSKNTPTESGPESFEELQRLFVEMFQSDIDAEFGGGGSGAGSGWNRETSSCSNKRGSSEMNVEKAEFDEMDMGAGGFCYGSTNPVGESSSRVRGNSSSNKRRNGRKEKGSSSKHHVSSRETYDNTLVH